MTINTIEMILGFGLALFLWFAAFKIAKDIGTGLAYLVAWWADRRAGR